MVKLRPAVADDALALAGVIAQAFEIYRGGLTPPSSSLDKTPEAVAQELTAASAIVAVTKTDVAATKTEVVGCIFFKLEGDSVYLSRLAVLPRYQRQGLAKRLVLSAEEAAAKAGARRVFLSVRLVLTELRAFYDGLGYRPESYGSHIGFKTATFVNLAKRL